MKIEALRKCKAFRTFASVRPIKKLKRTVAIIFLFAITLQACAQLMVLVTFIANQKYISEQLCVNRFDRMSICKGSCYLKDKLEKQAPEEQKTPVLKLQELQLYTPNFEATTLQTAYTTLFAIKVINHQVTLKSAERQGIFHPPQA